VKNKRTAQPHHIANIAHLFFADATEAPAAEHHDGFFFNVVVSLAKADICDYVCWQLNAEAKLVGQAKQNGTARLNVKAKVNGKAKVNSKAEANGQEKIWRVWDGNGAMFARSAHAKGEIRVRPHLILCVLDHEIDDCEAALKIGRLLGSADPRSLQVLVFPETCREGDGKVSWSWPKKRFTGPTQGALLNWCGQLSRSLAGRCPVTVTVMPANDSSRTESSTWAPANHIFSAIVQRMLE